MLVQIIGYIGMALVITGFFLISDKGKWIRFAGFIVNAAGCVFMLTQAVMLEILPIVFLNSFMILMSARGVVTTLRGKK